MALKILVVDDEPEILSMIEFFLKNEGYEVLKAYKGVAALNIIFNDNVDLIILDVLLPDKSGFQICEIIKNDPRYTSIPVFIISAKNEPGDFMTSLKVKANEYFQKPFNMEDILNKIKEYFPPETSGGNGS